MFRQCPLREPPADRRLVGMSASLLPRDRTAARESLERSAGRLREVFPEWPAGHPTARLLQEYLAGRAAGELDLSGRFPQPETAAPLLREAAVTLVLDDSDGALTLVSAGISSSPHVVRCDSAAEAAAVAAAVARCEGSGGSVAALSAVEVVRGSGQGEDRNPFSEVCRCVRGVLSEEGPAAGGFRKGHAEDAPEFAAQSGLRLRVIVSAPKQVRALGDLLHLVGAIMAGQEGRPHSDVELVLAGREKHMTKAFNGELEAWFSRVDVSPGLAKSRLLIATGWRGASGAVGSSPGLPTPVVRDGISAFGACYGGSRVDAGARLLLEALRAHAAEGPAGSADDAGGSPLRVLDLGCGNGWLLREVRVLFPGARLAGVDDSWAAAASARMTLDVNGSGRGGEGTHEGSAFASGDGGPVLRHADGTAALPWGEGFEAGAFDLVTLNPPFHEGTTVTTDTAHALIDSAHALLRPGGLLVLVQNSHLRYRSHLASSFAHVEQWARDRRFTVLAAWKQ
ncbi:hypothetical protein GCM10009823_23490 [Brevibacterium salitolerans]|uniref:Methyltransferase small domain-containing protein n=2 Tax=Brevibacterium salitolerans TaxID=1403566 RepID=A0ABN2WXB0_9MICO